MSACAMLAPAKISAAAANACNCQPGFRNLVIFTSMRTLIYSTRNLDRFSGSGFSHLFAGRSSARTTAEIAFDDPRIAFETGGAVRQDDPTGFDDITAFG